MLGTVYRTFDKGIQLPPLSEQLVAQGDFNLNEGPHPITGQYEKQAFVTDKGKDVMALNVERRQALQKLQEAAKVGAWESLVWDGRSVAVTRDKRGAFRWRVDGARAKVADIWNAFVA